MLKNNIIIVDNGENNFSISPCNDFFYKSNSYLRPFKIYVEFDKEIQSYQYSINDLVSLEILTTGWFEAIDKTDAIKQVLGILGNFIQNQAKIFDSLLSDIIDFRYDIINNNTKKE